MVWNTRNFLFSKIALDDANDAVKAQKGVFLALMERPGVHLALKGPHAHVCLSSRQVSCSGAAQLSLYPGVLMSLCSLLAAFLPLLQAHC